MTEDQLFEAINNGSLSDQDIEMFSEQYENLLREVLEPVWLEQAEQSREFWRDNLAFLLDMDEVSWVTILVFSREWVRAHSQQLVNRFTQSQVGSIRASIERYTVDSLIPKGELARHLRYTIGLSPQQSRSLSRYRDSLQREGIKRSTLLNRIRNRSARMLRTRASAIVKTETARVWNTSSQILMEYMRDNHLQDGYIIEKVFVTALDEKVCPICRPLDGRVIGIEEKFKDETYTYRSGFQPPIHTRCRCTVQYRIVNARRSSESPFF